MGPESLFSGAVRSTFVECGKIVRANVHNEGDGDERKLVPRGIAECPCGCGEFEELTIG